MAVVTVWTSESSLSSETAIATPSTARAVSVAATAGTESSLAAVSADAKRLLPPPEEGEGERPYRIEFFLAPWRRAGDKGPAHYLSIGAACAIYLFVVGGSLTYIYVAESGWAQYHVCDFPNDF